MVNTTKIRCSNCGSPVNAQAQFCEQCGSAVARSPLPRSSDETWDDDMETPTVQEVRLSRPRPVSPLSAASSPAYKFHPEHLALLGGVSAAVLGIIAFLSALFVMSKGHTIGGGLCMIAAAFAFGLLALSGGRKS